MSLWDLIRLYSECFKVAKYVGLQACNKYICGYLVLPDLDPESLDLDGDHNE